MPLRVVVEDIEVAVNVAGEGPLAIVLLHGLGGTRETWSTVIPVLANGARVFAPDLRGCGETSRGTAPWTLARAAEDIRMLARSLGLQRYVVVGHSLGGVIAQEMLIARDPSIGAGVLVSTSSRLNEKAALSWQRLADQVETTGIPDDPAGQVRGYAVEWAATNPDIVAVHARIAAATSPSVYAEQARAASAYDYSGALSGVACPVLVVQGLADRLTPPGGSVLLHRALPPGNEIEMVEAAGHNLPIEMPERFAEIVLRFASKHLHRTADPA